jgi:hypothetical protein
MTYRDEQEALRARLEATEQRLREAESELAEARRLLAEQPSALEPSTPPPPSRRVGHPQPSPPGASLARTLAGSGGAVLSLFGIGFMLWNLPGAALGELVVSTLVSALLFLGPGGLLVWFSLRQPARRQQQSVDALALRRLAESIAVHERVKTRVGDGGDVDVGVERSPAADEDFDGDDQAVASQVKAQ